MNRLTRAVLGCAAITILLAAACSRPRSADQKTRGQPVKPATVTVVAPERRPVSREVVLTATVEAYEQVPLYAKVAGYLKTINVDIGDRVKQGELLAILEAPEVDQRYRAAQSDTAEGQADLDKARADAELAGVIFVRSKDLRAKEAITQEDMDEARARHAAADAQVEVAASRLRAAQARMAEASALLSYLRITSPFDGIVTRRFVDPGALLQAATGNNTVSAIVTIARMDIVRVFVDVPEPDAPLITIGEPAALRVGALPQHAFKGSVTRYAGALDPATRTMRTEVDLVNYDGMLRPGTYGDLTIHAVDRRDALTVPGGAIHHDDQGAFVYVLDSGRALRRTVETGVTSGDFVEITRGIDDHTRVIGESSAELSSGALLRLSTAARENRQEGDPR
jgi:RND family efflux transporter MFP subunit